MKRLIVTVLAVIVVLVPWSLPNAEAADGFQVIVNPANDITEISKKDLASLMLKKKTKWPESGVKADPVDLVVSSAVREAFSKAIHGRGTNSIESFWQRQIFSGKGVPPTKMASDAEVIAHVKASTGAVGYVSAGASLDGVKVVAIVN